MSVPPLSKLPIEQRIVKALSHPIRMRALAIMNERVASPVEIARDLDENLGQVAYHVKILDELGCIELVETIQRRGAIEHRYRALVRPWLTADQVKEMPRSLRTSLSGATFAELAKDIRAAAEDEGLARHDHAMVRVPLVLDEDGWATLAQRMQEVLDFAIDLQAESMARLVEQGEDAESVSAVLGMMLFERETPEHERTLKSASRDASAPGPRRPQPVAGK
jgi:DNA-binding transcriptional ArsR family regulator